MCAARRCTFSACKRAAAALDLRLPPDAAQQIGSYLQALPDAAPYRVKVLPHSDGLH